MSLSFRQLITVDPSLTCSGWALFDVHSTSLLAVGKIRSLPPGNTLARRLAHLQDCVSELILQFDLGSSDILICEAPTTMRDPRAAIKVEQVRGIFETLARQRRLNVPGRINPRSVQHEVMGLLGRQVNRAMVKQVAIQVAKILYAKDLEKLKFDISESNLKKQQDIVDAILLGNFALNRLKNAMRAYVSLDMLFENSRQSARRRFIQKSHA